MSLFTGVTGLRANQQMLDVVGNNLANGNTPGFKTQRVQFADLMYQTLRPAAPGSGTVGGTNPMQTGFGVRPDSISTLVSQGSLEPTGRDLDMGIQGNGFFVVSDGTRDLYTRAGTFDVDSNNFMIDAGTGFTVQRFGTVGEGTLTTPAFQVVGDNRINIPFGSGIPGQATTTVSLLGNLSANAGIGDQISTAIQVYDVQGTAHVLTLDIQKTALNTWQITGSIPAAEGSMVINTIPNVTFNDDGSLAGPPPPANLSFNITGLAATQTVAIDLGTVNGFDGLTQFGGTSSAAAMSQDGFAAGVLTSISIGKDGTINGIFSNGRTLAIAQMAVANFANPAGLTREGTNKFTANGQSGVALIGAGTTGGRGSVESGTLESSNVDISLEFTRLIIAQRGFSINARTITVSDQVLQELTNIIR